VSPDLGGAIENIYGGMTVSGCLLTFNRASSGGGIYNFHGVLNVMAGSSIDDNNATVVGGGIYTSGTANQVWTNIIDSEVSGNTPDDTHTEVPTTLTVVNSIVLNRT
jgi:hypothetical protein